MMKKLFIFCLTLLPLISYSQNKPKIIFGDLDWDSSRFHVSVASYIIQHGYKREVDRIPGTTVPMLTALGRGDVHVLMEIWKQNIKDAWDKFHREKKVIDLGLNFPDGIQGWFVPTYMIHGDTDKGIKATAPGLKNISDLKNYKNLFATPANPNKGRFYNCMLGWSCEDVNTKKLKAYKLLDDFENFRPGTSSALAAAIASNYKQGKPFIAYYWGPTWLLGSFDLTMIKEPPYDSEIWDKFTSGDDLSKATAYPVVQVNIGVNAKWSKSNPEITQFLKKYEMKPGQTSKALSFIQEKKGRTPNDAAINFLRFNESTWKSWVSEDAYTKIKKQLERSLNTKKETWKINIGDEVNESINWLVKNYGDTFRKSTLPILKGILFAEKILLSLPWYALAILVSLLALWMKKATLFFGIIISFSMINFLGLWEMSMQTLALMLISTIVSAFFGLPLGILSSKSNRFRKVLLPIMDAMQTMPSFVYLIPALMLLALERCLRYLQQLFMQLFQQSD